MKSSAPHSWDNLSKTARSPAVPRLSIKHWQSKPAIPVLTKGLRLNPCTTGYQYPYLHRSSHYKTQHTVGESIDHPRAWVQRWCYHKKPDRCHRDKHHSQWSRNHQPTEAALDMYHQWSESRRVKISRKQANETSKLRVNRGSWHFKKQELLDSPNSRLQVWQVHLVEYHRLNHMRPVRRGSHLCCRTCQPYTLPRGLSIQLHQPQMNGPIPLQKQCCQ